MIGKRDLVVAFLVGCCVMALLFAVMPIHSAGEPVYDPWTDLNDDGVVDSTDLGMLGYAWGSFGTPIAKASLQFDSGWIDISDKCGQYFSITHNLNSSDVAVEIMGKSTVDGSPFYMDHRTTNRIPGWNKTYGGTNLDETWSMVQTGDEGYALAGYTYSFGAGSYDAWLVKTDAELGLFWTYSSLNAITLCRGATDLDWNYVQVRIWTIKQSP
jgi:hypothetical protein